jgi:hypothetical protein
MGRRKGGPLVHPRTVRQSIRLKLAVEFTAHLGLPFFRQLLDGFDYFLEQLAKRAGVLRLHGIRVERRRQPRNCLVVLEPKQTSSGPELRINRTQPPF